MTDVDPIELLARLARRMTDSLTGEYVEGMYDAVAVLRDVDAANRFELRLEYLFGLDEADDEDEEGDPT